MHETGGLHVMTSLSASNHRNLLPVSLCWRISHAARRRRPSGLVGLSLSSHGPADASKHGQKEKSSMESLQVATCASANNRTVLMLLLVRISVAQAEVQSIVLVFRVILEILCHLD